MPGLPTPIGTTTTGPFFAITFVAVGAYVGGFHWWQVITQPVLLTIFAGGLAKILGFVAWEMMAVAFQPTLRLYRASPIWGILLPGIALFYMAFTLDSAYRHMQGAGGMWKGRVQAGLAEEAPRAPGLRRAASPRTGSDPTGI